jgi:thiamine pyrophosphate-dependent acetolactate synthase large subunit-like protein
MGAVVALAERMKAPVATTFKAKGLIPDHHPLGCGVLGRSGTPIASWFMNESDLLIVFGASFSNHTVSPPISPPSRSTSIRWLWAASMPWTYRCSQTWA